MNELYAHLDGYTHTRHLVANYKQNVHTSIDKSALEHRQTCKLTINQTYKQT